MEEDLTAKNCLAVDERYADLVNGLLLGGEQVLNASDLRELDSQQWNRQGKRRTKYRQLYLDLIKKTAFGVNFSLIGVENQKLKELVEGDSAYQELEEDAYDMIAAYTKVEKFVAIKDKYKEKEKVNMCQALNELLEDSRLTGVEQGIEQGIERGTEQAIFRIVYKKIKKNYTLDMIADDLEEEAEVIRPLYERALKELEEKKE